MEDRTLARFEAKVSRDECWIWTGATDGKGYPLLRVEGKTQRAHRLAYEHFIGPIPTGLQIDHLCRTTGCVNPVHLDLVTNRENQRRGRSRGGTLAPLRTHCKHGHEFTPENTRVYLNSRNGKPWRQCVTCVRERSQHA